MFQLQVSHQPLKNFNLIIQLNKQIQFLDLSIGDSQNVTFKLNQEYDQLKHIFGALCKFLNLNNNRIKELNTEQENGNYLKKNIQFKFYKMKFVFS